MIPDPTSYLSPTLPKADRPAVCQHIWRHQEGPVQYPPPPDTFDYECRLCHGKQRSTRVLGHCHYCSKYELLTRDHIVPRARGGVDEDYNLIGSCEICNRLKADDAPTCRCQRCREAVLMHLQMIEAIDKFSPRWAERLILVYQNGPAANRSGFHSPARMGSG